MRRLILLGLCLAASSATAQTPGSCAPGVAQNDLATPDLFARLFNTGSLFYGNATTAGDGYLVPRVDGHSSIFAAGLWVGGTVGGEVRTAAERYENFQFWPGPLDPGATLPNPTDCSAYDRIYVVSPADVAAYEAGGPATVDLREWPVGLGAPAVDAQGLPVPVFSRDQRLDLPGGERPVLYGGPTAFWVMNDVGNVRPDGSAPLGIEVRATAFAMAGGSALLRQSTFYRYTVVNRNTVPIENLHVGFFADPDLGNFADDYVGVDTTRGMALAYNATNADAQYGVPPALGFDLLSGLWASAYFVGAPGPTTDPHNPDEYYARLQGLWNDGTTIREFGDGYGETQGSVTRFTYPGDPVTGAFWSERAPIPGSPANTPGDRRFMMSAPAATLAPGEARTVELGILFAQGTNNLQSITALRSVSDVVQTIYDSGGLFGTSTAPALAAPTPLAPADGASFYETAVTFSWTAVPGADFYALEVSPAADFSRVEVATTDGATTTITLPPSFFAANRTTPFYWRVRAIGGGVEGLASAPRAVTVYRYEAAPLALTSGALAYVEVTAPGGAPACTGPSDPDEGCAEVGGDLVYRSLNSTGDYLGGILGGAETAPGAFAPNDFEVRFTAQGSIAYSGAGASLRLFRVPFELWDLGVVVPGTANDPADDRQLVGLVGPYFGTAAGPPCAFEYVNLYALPDSARVSTRSIRAYYATGAGYADFAALAAPVVAADPAGCPVGTVGAPARARVDVNRGSPVRSFFLEQASTRPVGELTGTTIRFYTADRVVAAEGGPTPGALALGAPFPNPAGGRVVVPFTVGAPGPVRLRLIDVLGRTVGVLAEGVRPAGAHEARLDTRGLAPGVYAVVLDAGGARAVRTLTVVR